MEAYNNNHRGQYGDMSRKASREYVHAPRSMMHPGFFQPSEIIGLTPMLGCVYLGKEKLAEGCMVTMRCAKDSVL